VAVVKERGSVIEEKDGIRYFLTYHPAAALRFPVKFKPYLKEDFMTVKKLAQKKA
jgi:uracil-DNA glycosylase